MEGMLSIGPGREKADLMKGKNLIKACQALQDQLWTVSPTPCSSSIQTGRQHRYYPKLPRC